MTYQEMIEKAIQTLKDDDSIFCDMVDELDIWNGYADGFRAYDMYELDELHYGMKLSDFLERVTKDFNLHDNYFYYSIYGLESTDDKAGLYRDNVDEGELLDEIIDKKNNLYFNDSDFESLIDDIINARDEEDDDE